LLIARSPNDSRLGHGLCDRRVRGAKELFCYKLHEPQQDATAVRLALGDPAEWCTVAHAKTSGNLPLVGKDDIVDDFTRAPRPAPAAACLLAPRRFFWHGVGVRGLVMKKSANW
jgi:hypothetical protein